MQSGAIFVLSGEEVSLPAAEIRALVQTYSPTDRCEAWARRVVFSTLSDPLLISKVTARAAYCRFGGMLVSSSEDMQPASLITEAVGIQEGKTFAVASETLDREFCGELGGKIQAWTGARVSLEAPDYLYQVEKTERGLVLALSRSGYKEFSWRERRPRARRFFLPSAIYPKLARLLVNLARVKEGELFLDPFCGTGSLLIEGAVMGLEVMGIDLVRWVSKGTLLNLKGFHLEDSAAVLRADATHLYLPLKRVDGIATDVPYGRAASTRGKDTGRILREFAATVRELYANCEGKYAVIMHPSTVELEYDRKSFEITETHYLYVHRSLTRAITVLRSR